MEADDLAVLHIGVRRVIAVRVKLVRTVFLQLLTERFVAVVMLMLRFAIAFGIGNASGEYGEHEHESRNET
jgi:hypothetical protein